MSDNYIQSARVNIGGMHLHHHETKLLSRLISAQRLGAGQITEVLESFAPRVYSGSDGLGEMDRESAARLLASEPYLVLIGTSGSGIRTAAMALFKEFCKEGRRLERIYVDEDSAESFTGADLPAEKGVVYLLPLPQQTVMSPRFAEALQGHAATLKSLDAHLVVTATKDVWLAGGGKWSRLVLDVAPPARADVLRTYPFRANFDRERLVAEVGHKARLDEATAAHAAELARIIDDLTYGRTGQPDSELIDQAIGAYLGWEDVLKKWFGSQSNSLRSRLFLTAGAMLEGLPAHKILTVMHDLGVRLGDLSGPRMEGLEQPGLRFLAENADADVDAGKLRFRKAGYAEAVLAFLHSDRTSTFRDGLWAWAVNLPIATNRQEASSLGARVVDPIR